MMKSKWAIATVDSIIHLAVWFLAEFAMSFVVGENPARAEYATISAWWCSLYAGYIRGIGFRSLLPLFVLTINLIIISNAFAAGTIPFFEDTLKGQVILIALSYLLLSSPVFINSTVRYVISRTPERLKGAVSKFEWSKPVLGAFIHLSAWFFAWLMVLYLADTHPARYAFAYVSAWWCSLYVGYVLGVRITSAIPLAVMYMFLVGVVEIVYEKSWFYRDPLTEISLEWFTLMAFRYLAFGSPIFINSAVRAIISRCRRK